MAQRNRQGLWSHKFRFTSMKAQCDLEKVIQLLSDLNVLICEVEIYEHQPQSVVLRIKSYL